MATLAGVIRDWFSATLFERRRGMGCRREHARDPHEYCARLKSNVVEFRGGSAVPATVPAVKPFFDGALPQRYHLIAPNGFSGLVLDQGAIGSCTAHAAIYARDIALLRGVMTRGRRKKGCSLEEAKVLVSANRLSRRYLYWVTRRRLGIHGDGGATIHGAVHTFARVGCVAEDDWPYSDSKNPMRRDYYDRTPPDEIADGAANEGPRLFWRLDRETTTAEDLIEKIRRSIVNGLPVVVGVELFDEGDAAGQFDTPPIGGAESIGAHALLVTGFDSMRLARGHRGWFCGPNSWGAAWGEDGFFWISFDHVRRGWIWDCWVATNFESVLTGSGA